VVGIGEPADIGRRARAVEPIPAQKTEVEQESSEQEHPEAEGVSTGKARSRAPIMSGTR